MPPAGSSLARLAAVAICYGAATSACDQVLGIEDLEVARSAPSSDAGARDAGGESFTAPDDAGGDSTAPSFCERPEHQGHSFCADFDRGLADGWSTFPSAIDGGSLTAGTLYRSAPGSLRAALTVPFTAGVDREALTAAKGFTGGIPRGIVMKFAVYLANLEAESSGGHVGLASVALTPYHVLTFDVAPTMPGVSLWEYFFADGGYFDVGQHPMITTSSLPTGRWISVTIDVDVTYAKLREISIDGISYLRDKPLFNKATGANFDVTVGLSVSDANGEVYFDDVTVDVQW